MQRAGNESPGSNLLRGICGTAFAIGLAHAVPALPQSDDGEALRELQQIAYFSAINVSVHSTGASSGSADAALSTENLTQYLQRQVAVHFPDIPYRPASPGIPDPDSAGSVSCRIWADSQKQPAVFQVRCQIATAARPSLIGDASFGYAPAELAPSVLREQIDQILKGMAVSLSKAKAAR